MKRFIFLYIIGFMHVLCADEFQSVSSQVGSYGTIDETLTHMIPGAVVEKVTIKPRKSSSSAERIGRKGILIRRNNAKANILMAHGFMCNKFDISFVRALFGTEYNFLTFDFRAHGEDTAGQTCTFGRDEALDVLAAANFIKHHPEIKELPLIAYGFSMGAASSIEAQAKNPYLFKAMVLDCPFDSTENVLKRSINTMTFSVFGYQFYVPGRQLLHKYAFHPYVQAALKPLLKIAANMDPRQIDTHICKVKPQDTIKKVTIPCLFICCKNDEKVSMEAIKSVYDGAGGFKRLWLTNGRNHCDSFFYNPECYSKRVNKFVHAVLDGSIAGKPQGKIVEDQTPLDCGGTIL